MAIGLTEEHEAPAASVRGFAERNITPRVARAADAGFWPALAAQGLPGLHLPEEAGGQGFGLLEQAVALEELGRVLAPGPYAPTVLASAVLHACGADVTGLADGSRTAAVALPGSLEVDGSAVSGTLRPVLGAPLAELFVLPAGDRWVVLDRDDVTVGPLESLDITRPVGSVTEKVFPEEVEAVLKGHPAVYDAVVTGIPDERWGSRVAAVVQPSGAMPSSADLDAHCRKELSGSKVPRVYAFVDEVKRSPAGKADYRWAKQIAEEAQ